MAQSINAKAFTVRNNVIFGKGEYSPEIHKGQKLLAHELAHVVQQGDCTAITTQKINPFQISMQPLDIKSFNTNGNNKYIVGLDDLFFVSNPEKYQNTIIGLLPQGTGVILLDQGVNETFNQTKDNYQWWKVQIANVKQGANDLLGRSHWFGRFGGIVDL